MLNNTQKNWYLIYSKSRQEHQACDNLNRQGYEVYLPRIIQSRRYRGGQRSKSNDRNKSNETITAMFPRYLFIRLDKSSDNWAPIRSTIGVSGLVQFGQYMAVVPDDLVRTLQSTCNTDGVQRPVVKDFQIGDRVRIIYGAAQDYEGLIQAKKSSERIELLLSTVAGFTTKVQLPQAWIEHTG